MNEDKTYNVSDGIVGH